MGRKTRAFLKKLGKAIDKTDKLIKEHKAEKAKKAANIKIGKPISGIPPKKPVATTKAVPSGKPIT